MSCKVWKTSKISEYSSVGDSYRGLTVSFQFSWVWMWLKGGDRHWQQLCGRSWWGLENLLLCNTCCRNARAMSLCRPKIPMEISYLAREWQLQIFRRTSKWCSAPINLYLLHLATYFLIINRLLKMYRKALLTFSPHYRVLTFKIKRAVIFSHSYRAHDHASSCQCSCTSMSGRKSHVIFILLSGNVHYAYALNYDSRLCALLLLLRWSQSQFPTYRILERPHKTHQASNYKALFRLLYGLLKYGISRNIALIDKALLHCRLYQCF